MNWIGNRKYPESLPQEIEIPSLTLYDLLEHSARRHPLRVAVIEKEKELTYVELKTACERLAAALYQKGFCKGDRVAVMLPNCTEYIISYYAVQRLGGIIVQVNPMYQAAELDYILQDSEAVWFISREEQRTKIDQINLKAPLNFISTNNKQNEEDNLYFLIKKGEKELPNLEIEPKEDLAVLQYTGGTTGKSKGVMLTHSNLFSNVYQDLSCTLNLLPRQESPERMLGLAPLFHVYGMARMNCSIFSASTYIAVERFEINEVVNLIRKHRPTIFPGVPTMYVALLNHPDLTAEDLSCFKYCSSGSASLPIEILQKFDQKFNLPIFEGYGMTETSPTTHRNPVVGKRKQGSIGLPYPNTDAKIVDIEKGIIELTPGEAGELIIKGPQVMKGYWRKENETAAVIRHDWLYTGDIATMDEDGYFYIVGRKKDMIIASGYNVYPVEIEDVIYQHPAVKEVCVFGVPDFYRGETVKAAIVLKADASATEQELEEWCTLRLAKYKVPRLIEFRNKLPKSTVGKILRRTLVEEEEGKRRKETD